MSLEYSYKVRLRFDVAIVKPIPNMELLSFNETSPLCSGSAIYYPTKIIFGQSAEDSFNIGRSPQIQSTTRIGHI
jgi:hypothetical protein